MDALNQEIAAPAEWANLWIEREWEPLEWYILAVSIGLTSAMVFNQVRGTRGILKARKELDANPTNRAAIIKDMNKTALWTDRSQFKIALVFLFNTLGMVMVDAGISMFALAKDVQDHPEVWDREMYKAIALYVAYLAVLFIASFVLVPLLQMFGVTWLLTRIGKKNKLSDYVPQARAVSSAFSVMWASICFMIVCAWPVVGESDDTSVRFFILEASWGSTLAWLEAAFLFNYLSHAIGDKELGDSSRVAEVSIPTGVQPHALTIHQIVSLFARAATSSFTREKKESTLPLYAEAPQTQPLLEKN